MKLKELQTETSVLFLGAGFSTEARNIIKTSPPTANKLKSILAKELDENEDDHSLEVLVDALNDKDPSRLYRIIQNNYTISRTSDFQDIILEKKWLRVYTTNFDDSVEFSHQKHKRNYETFTARDKNPGKIAPYSVIHIHGSINNISENQINTDLIFGQESYVRTIFESSPWFEDLDRNIDHCSNMFFVGYGAQDHHILSILLQKPGRKEKIFFITNQTPNNLQKERLEKYGTVLPIAVKGFADLCESLPAPSPLRDFTSLKAFKLVDPTKDRKVAISPTRSEITNLLIRGILVDQRCFTTLPGENYVISRKSHIDNIIFDLKKNRGILIHSFLGNGKSIFSKILAYFLSVERYRVLFFRTSGPALSKELLFLKTQPKLAILFDNYDEAINSLSEIRLSLPGAKLILFARTGLMETRMAELIAALPQDTATINLNLLSPADIVSIKKLTLQAGLFKQDLHSSAHVYTDIREIVSGLYQNQAVKVSVTEQLSRILPQKSAKRLTIYCLLCSWAAIFPNSLFAKRFIGSDPFIEILRNQEIFREVLTVDDSGFSVRSSIFSNYLLENHIPIDDIIEVIKAMLLEAVEKKYGRVDQAVLSNFMMFSALRRLFSKHEKAEEKIIDMYEDIGRDVLVSKEPLYWLQYAISKDYTGEINEASDLLDTAYFHADNRHGFRTYQLDTFALGFYLKREAGKPQGKIDDLEKIMTILDRCITVLPDKTHTSYILASMNHFSAFFMNRKIDIDPANKFALSIQLKRIVSYLESLTIGDRAIYGTDNLKLVLISAISACEI